MKQPRRPGQMKPEDVAAGCEALVKDLRPIFVGKPPEVQSAALGELMVTYLAGHHVFGQPLMQTTMRKELFNAWCQLVMDLMNHYEAEEIEPTIQ